MKPAGNALGPIVPRWLARLAARARGAGEPRAGLLVVSGWEVDGSRSTWLALSPRGDRPRIVGKIGRGAAADRVREEAGALEALGRACRADPSLEGSVPRLLEIEEHAGGEVALVESALDGRPLSRELGADPFSTWAPRIARWLARWHAAAAKDARAEPGALATCVARRLERYRDRFDTSPEEEAALREALELAESLGHGIAPTPRHGDLCPANVLVSTDGGVRVLDWESPPPDGIPGEDLVHFLACLGHDLGARRPARMLESVFLRSGRWSGRTRDALALHSRELELPLPLLKASFIAHWAAYAVEAADVSRSHAAAPGSRAWGLVEIVGRTCPTFRMLAERLEDLSLPGRDDDEATRQPPAAPLP